MQYQFIAVELLGEVAYYRFDKSKNIDIKALLESDSSNLGKLVQNKTLVAIEDLIEIRVDIEFDNSHNIIL
jgi:hypothetical protein